MVTFTFNKRESDPWSRIFPVEDDFWQCNHSQPVQLGCRCRLRLVDAAIDEGVGAAEVESGVAITFNKGFQFSHQETHYNYMFQQKSE